MSMDQADSPRAATNRKQAMPTYEYETIPQHPGEEPMPFEVWQSMAEEPLTTHPETGQPVRRLISGGLMVMSKKGSCCRSSCRCQ